jgi:inosine triphosphate pyrophosphatase
MCVSSRIPIRKLFVPNVDDTSPPSKWFLKSIGLDGLNNLLAAYDDKSAKAVCTFAYSPGPGHEPILFQGITDGKIVPARGPGNFGASPSAPFNLF